MNKGIVPTGVTKEEVAKLPNLYSPVDRSYYNRVVRSYEEKKIRAFRDHYPREGVTEVIALPERTCDAPAKANIVDVFKTLKHQADTTPNPQVCTKLAEIYRANTHFPFHLEWAEHYENQAKQLTFDKLKHQADTLPNPTVCTQVAECYNRGDGVEKNDWGYMKYKHLAEKLTNQQQFKNSNFKWVRKEK